MNMVTSKQTQNDIRMLIHIYRIDISFAVSKINGIETIIEPIHSPLVLMSYPTHRRGQTRKRGNTRITCIVVTDSLYNNGITAHMTVQPADGGIISRCIIITIWKSTSL